MDRQGWQDEVEQLTRQVRRAICGGRREKLDRLELLIAEGEVSSAGTGAEGEAAATLRRAEAALLPFLKMRGMPGDPARR